MKKLIVQLNGGLGNQMFQYATCRAVAQRNAAELVLDTWSGFVRDRQYRREYELGAFSIGAREASRWEQLPTWLYRLDQKFFRRPVSLFQSKLYGHFITETKSEYLDDVTGHRICGTSWITGYWQSYKYFADLEASIAKELAPPEPSDPKFLQLADRMSQSESVALGVRLYEESLDPAIHSRDRRIKSVDDINQVIDAILARVPNACFYVFCTHRSPLLSDLRLPKRTVFVTHDDGYNGTTERLWLLSRCKHHVITNSSYYWWGAWLSGKIHEPNDQIIFAADNFKNTDCLPVNWSTF
ncbi:alpha-1,2-fucosyltransferase [Novipirellula sp. SH528]|uniref:alpha-1,2-fucosyltransferase n=1 Tax=Novipirellula sp. SH528 TaxID=3454466 RepID=UPI003F9EBEB3